MPELTWRDLKANEVWKPSDQEAFIDRLDEMTVDKPHSMEDVMFAFAATKIALEILSERVKVLETKLANR